MDKPDQASQPNEPSDEQLAAELILLSRYGGPTRPGAFDAVAGLRSLMAHTGLADSVPTLLDLLDRALARVERTDLREVGLVTPPGRSAERRWP